MTANDGLAELRDPEQEIEPRSNVSPADAS